MQLKVLRICQLSKLEVKEKTWHFVFEATFPNQMWGLYPQDMQSFKKGSNICLKWGSSYYLFSRAVHIFWHHSKHTKLCSWIILENMQIISHQLYLFWITILKSMVYALWERCSKLPFSNLIIGFWNKHVLWKMNNKTNTLIPDLSHP